MIIGISGHQDRAGIDWKWVRDEIDRELAALPGRHIGYSSLAIGSDQIFAGAILDRGDELVAVVPMRSYEACLEGGALRRYRKLKSQASVVQLDGGTSEERAFYDAGVFIVDHVERMIAIWDGNPSQGLGGTADIVAYAVAKSIPVACINPTTMTVGNL